MAAKSAVNPCCPEEKSVVNPPAGVVEEEAAEDAGCKIPPADDGKLEWEKEELPWVMGWRRPPPPAAGAAVEGCRSPLEAGEMEEREEPGLGCRLVKDELLPWAEAPPVGGGVGCRSPVLPPPGAEV